MPSIPPDLPVEVMLERMVGAIGDGRHHMAMLAIGVVTAEGLVSVGNIMQPTAVSDVAAGVAVGALAGVCIAEAARTVAAIVRVAYYGTSLALQHYGYQFSYDSRDK